LELLNRIYRFYYDGFTQMRVGKRLWAIILLKLFILFVVIKWLFFPNLLQENFQTDAQRSDYILQQLTQPKER